MAPNNPLPIWGNEKTMNLNTLLLTNIQSSPYFKVQLYELKTYHEVIDEIYYKVSHLEPWEKGSRKTAGQTGMCGGVRGVGAGGIVSSAFCLLYKLFTLRLTKKQVNGLLNHNDSPFIRGLGFMYIRFTQNPSELWDWFEPYLLDDEEIDVKAGGGCTMTIGEMAMQFLTKLDWYATLFPRIPVPIQKEMDVKLKAWRLEQGAAAGYGAGNQDDYGGPRGGGGRYDEASGRQRYAAAKDNDDVSFGEAERQSSSLRRSPPVRDRNDRYTPSHRSPPPKRRSPERRGSPNPDFSRELDRERERQRRERDKGSEPSRDKGSEPSRDKGSEPSRRRDSPSRSDKYRDRDRDHKRSRSYERSSKYRSKSGSPQREKRRSSRSPKRDSYKSSRYRDSRNGYP